MQLEPPRSPRPPVSRPPRAPLTESRGRAHTEIGRYRGPGSGLPLMLLVAAALGGLGFGGYKLYQRVVLGAGKASLECGLIIETKFARCTATFHQYPGGDATDVRVDFSGPTLARPASFDWKFLAPLDGRYGPILRPDEKPTLARQFLWRMPLETVPVLKAGFGDFIVTAKLYWAGQQQDRALFNTKVLYTPEK